MLRTVRRQLCQVTMRTSDAVPGKGQSHHRRQTRRSIETESTATAFRQCEKDSRHRRYHQQADQNKAAQVEGRHAFVSGQ